MSVSRLYCAMWQLLPPQWQSSGLLLGCCVLVASYYYNSIVLANLGESLRELSQLASPAQSIAVALLGLCLFPTARARFSSSQQPRRSSSSRPGCGSTSGQNSAAEDDAADNSSSTSAAAGGTCSSFKLARAPFADLSCGISASFACTSSKARRRRLPRLSVELTPLPRLSLDFQQRRRLSSSGGSRLSDASGCSLSDCALFAPAAAGAGGSGRWTPAMGRIPSGQDLAAAAGAPAEAGDEAREATASLGLGALPPGLEHLDEVINETHLLQVGAMLGEPTSRAALVAGEAGGPVGHPASFYGSADTDAFLGPWEPLADEASPGVLYWAWRRPLRKGLFMYMTRSVFLGASPAELRAFMNDDVYRSVWDGSMSLLRRVDVPCGQQGAGNASVEAMAAAVAARTASSGFSAVAGVPFADGETTSSSSLVLAHETGVLQALVQFPKPMASRSYLYARRVWHRPSDGGCYCLAKSSSLPDAPALPCRAVAVDDYASGCVIRSPSAGLLPPGFSGSDAAEVFMVYFEDSHVRPGLANLGIKKGLWPLVLRTDKALRVYQAGAAANIHLQAQGQQPLLQQLQPDMSGMGMQLQTASSTPSGGLSRQGSLQMPPAQALERQASLQAHPQQRPASVPCAPLAGLEGDQTSDDEDDDAAGPHAAVAAAAPATTPQPSQLAPSAVAAREAAAVPSAAAGSPREARQCSSPARPAPTSVKAAPAAAQSQQHRQQPELHASHSKGCTSSSSASKASSISHKKGSSWWSRLASAVGGALHSSGQLLAAASITLWRSNTRLALMLPSLEWRLLRWLLRSLEGPCRLLLGSGRTASSGRPGQQLEPVSSHPIGDWAHPGLLPRLQALAAGPSLLRIPSHPLAVDDLQGHSPACLGCHHQQQHHQQQHHCCCCVAAVHGCCGRRVAQAAFGGGADAEAAAAWPPGSAHGSSCSSARLSSGAVGVTAGLSCEEAWLRCCVASSSSDITPAGTCSTCCSCGRTSAAGSTSSSLCRGSSASGGRHSSSGGSSSRVRDCSGGRRHRRVIARLMQAASVRLAHKLLSVLEHPADSPGDLAAASAAAAEF